MTDGVRKLARKIHQTNVRTQQTSETRLHVERAEVTAVSGSTATVDYGNGDTVDVPFYAHVSGLTTGSIVDVLCKGPVAVVIIGRY